MFIVLTNTSFMIGAKLLKMVLNELIQKLINSV